MRSIILFLSTTLCILLLLPGCRNEEAVEQQQLLGRWEVAEALRNGRNTETLDNLYFEFGPDGSMYTNLAGQDESGTYEMQEGKLLQRQTSLEVDYQIKEISDSTLLLVTELRNYEFRLRLRRASSTEPAQ